MLQMTCWSEVRVVEFSVLHEGNSARLILEDIFLHLRTDFHLEILFCFLFQDGIFFEVSKQPWKAQRPIFQAQHLLSLAPQPQPPEKWRNATPPTPKKRGTIWKEMKSSSTSTDFQGIAVGFQGSKTLPVFFFFSDLENSRCCSFISINLRGPQNLQSFRCLKKWARIPMFSREVFYWGSQIYKTGGTRIPILELRQPWGSSCTRRCQKKHDIYIYIVIFWFSFLVSAMVYFHYSDRKMQIWLFTPWKIDGWKLKIACFEKDNHLPDLHF